MLENQILLHRPKARFISRAAPCRAKPSEFRPISPGSTQRDSYKTNLTLRSTKSNHKPKVSRLDRPGVTYNNQISVLVQRGAARLRERA